MTGKKKDKVESLGIVLLVLLISGACMIPCFKAGLPYGDDQQVHMLRVESILKALKSGQGYPVYIYQTMLEGYGYGMGIFYPDLFLLPAVLFRLLGASPEIAMKLYIYVLMVCTGFAAYYSGKCIGRSRYAGTITMVLYTMGHYHLEDVYTRFALGEVAAMIFAPLAFLGLYDLTEMGHSRKGLLCISYACLMLSHTISFVLCVVMGIIWVFAGWKKFAACRRLIVAVCMEVLACAVLTCYYWLPVLEQFVDGEFYVSNEPAFYTHEETQSLLAIVSGKYSVAFIEIGILALMLFVSIYKKVYNKKALMCLVTAAVLLVCETKIFPWKLIDRTPFVSIQFPWRLNMFTEFFAALGIALQSYELMTLISVRKRYMYACVAGSVLIGLFNMNMVWNIELGGYVNYPEGYADNAGSTDSIGFWEWLPAEGDLATSVGSENSGMVKCEDTYIQGRYGSDGSYEFDAGEAAGECVVPKYYYKGYEAIMADGRKLTVSKCLNNGLAEISVPPEAGKVIVKYKGTKIQYWSWIISISAVMLMLLILVMQHADEKGKIQSNME